MTAQEMVYDPAQEKVSASDVRRDIDDFEDRLAHGAVYSAAPRRQPPPGAHGAAANAAASKVAAAKKAQAAAAAAAAAPAPLQRPLTVEPEEGEEPDEKLQRRKEVAQVRALPDYGAGSDSD